MKKFDEKRFIDAVRHDLNLRPNFPTDRTIMDTTNGSFFAAKIRLKIAWADLVASVKRSFKK